MFMSLSASADGLLGVANSHMDRVFEISGTLRWFGQPMETLDYLDEPSANLLRVEACAAWGIFNYIT